MGVTSGRSPPQLAARESVAGGASTGGAALGGAASLGAGAEPDVDDGAPGHASAAPTSAPTSTKA